MTAMGAAAARTGAWSRRSPMIVVLASALLHLVVLTLLGLQAPKGRWPTFDRSRPIDVDLVRSSKRARPAVQVRTPPELRSPRAPGLARPSAEPAGPGAAAPPAAVAQTPPATAAGQNPSLNGPAVRPGLLPGEDGRGAQALLKDLVGCDLGASGHRTLEEKARCDRRLAEATRGAAPFSGIPPEKREYYDAVVRRYAELRDPTPAPKGTLPGAPELGKRLNFTIPLAACGMKFGGPPQPKDKRGLTDRIKQDGFASIDVGPLTCGIPIPTGSMTPEVGIASTPP